MVLVVIALIPCILSAIWNSGVQSFVYSSGDAQLMRSYLLASDSWSGYWEFGKVHRKPILKAGLTAFLPLVLISYTVGGLWEGLFAIVRKHEIAEGFLVTGILYALILPPTIPYWMSPLEYLLELSRKELFGGTGMNILNPAFTCSCFLYFTFPTYMTGSIWSGTNISLVQESFENKEQIDGTSQASALTVYNISNDIKRIHVDAIASNNLHKSVLTLHSFKQ